ncbi:MAG TPA: AMP-binding protein, partial [Gemmatimonadales bacterium]|nr:AMP-binding protein [Gemmatimonadales bacterium]
MLEGCVPFPAEAAERYRRAGYWRGETLGDLLRRWAENGGERPAVSGPGRTMTYAELDAAADRVAAGLRRLGLRRGERVVVQLPNVVEFPAVVFGLLRLGALPVFALPPHREHEITYLVEHSGAAAYLACARHGDFDYGQLGAAARKASPALRHVILLDAGVATGDNREAENGGDDGRGCRGDAGAVDLRAILD